MVDLLQEYDPRLAGYKAMALVSIHTDTCQFIDDNATGFKVAASKAGKASEASQYLTGCMENRYAAQTGLPNHPGSITRDMTDYHTFSEVDSSTPVAIIEIGFLYLDRTFLTQHADRVAQGLADGIVCFTRNETVDTTVPPTP
jgi:N-acetylmuramoyl-L-alanine amidase.